MYIKRADAIKAVEDWAVNLGNPKMLVREDAILALKDIPSAEPEMVCIGQIHFDDEKLHEIVNEAVKKLKEEIESKQGEWIPCSERLPTLNEDGVSDMVLLCWSDGQRTVGAYRGDRTFVGQAWPVARDCRVTVIAWMALPGPWEGADDERL